MTSERGFTLAEVLVAAFLVAVGLAGLLASVPLGSFAVQEGKQVSTATFLANQKLEEVRHMPWKSLPAKDCLGVSTVPNASPRVPAGATCTLGATTVTGGGVLPWFTDQMSGSPSAIPGFPEYSRLVRVTGCDVLPCAGITNPALRRVTVTVRYRASTGVAISGGAMTSVVVTMMVAQR